MMLRWTVCTTSGGCTASVPFQSRTTRRGSPTARGGGLVRFGHITGGGGEPVFHDAWEGRVWFLRRQVVGVHTTTDRIRSTIEQMPPAEYLASTYYERWLWALERLAAEQGLLDSR